MKRRGGAFLAMAASVVLAAACSFDFRFLDAPNDGGTLGSPGSAGVPGSAGIPGAAGTAGTPGAAGIPGAPGTAGAAGNPGEPGSPSSAGSPGSAGTPGSAGSPGDGGPDAQPDAGTLPAIAPGTVGVGTIHACGFHSNGRPRCWGVSSHGQLGQGENFGLFISVPTSPADVLTDATSPYPGQRLAVGGTFTCALSTGNGVSCWGDSTFNQRGASGPNVNFATNILGATPLLLTVDRITAGEKHACARKAGGEVWCWGDNELRQADFNATQDLLNGPRPVTGVSNALDVVAGVSHTCVIASDKSVRCWGANAARQCGVASSATACTGGACVRTATAVAGVANATEVGAGAVHTCASVRDAVVCWGQSVLGAAGAQCDSGATCTVTSATQVPAIGAALRLALGDRHSCAIVADRTVWCWGANEQAQLAQGASDSASHATPLQVTRVGGAVLDRVVDIAARGALTCARTADSKVWCWGTDVTDGQASTKVRATERGL